MAILSMNKLSSAKSLKSQITPFSKPTLIWPRKCMLILLTFFEALLASLMSDVELVCLPNSRQKNINNFKLSGSIAIKSQSNWLA